MQSFLIALGFLTILPVGVKDASEEKIARSMAYFPLAGLLLGVILTSTGNLLSFFAFKTLPISIILTVLLALLTGGLHLDGLTDTIDALASRKNKEECLVIMRQAQVGAIGVLGLICVLLLKIALVSSIISVSRPTALLLMCVLSRWAQVFSVRSFAYARDNGKAKVFFNRMNNKIFIIAGFSALFLSVWLLRLNGLNLFIMTSIFTFFCGRVFTLRFGGLTGDTIGAINEITEIFVLFILIVLNALSNA